MVKHLMLFMLLTLQVHALKLDRVILATDANPDYIEFWPIVAKAWKEIVGIKPTLALIAHADVSVDESLGDVIRFEPIEGIPTSFQAQVIRLLLPVLYPDDVCILSDIDMIPLNQTYFLDSIASCPNDSFVVYRDKAYNESELKYPMCYLAAQGSTFQEIFDVTTLQDIRKKIKKLHKHGLGWNTDELMLYDYLQKWEGFASRCVKLGHAVQKRIDRSYWNHDRRLLRLGHYIDAHCPRPYSQYKKSIDQLIGKGKSRLSEISMHPHNAILLKSRQMLGDLNITGETHIIRTLIREGDTVFDVGANCGDWTSAVLQHASPTSIFAFEPMPSVAELFRKNIKHDQVCLYEVALARNSDVSDFYYYPRTEGVCEDGVLSSLYRRSRVESLFDMQGSQVSVATISLDEFCSEHAVDHIHFLKIDTEGAEYDVLLGATNLLHKKCIDFVQFEYGQTYVDSGYTLKEVYQFLTGFGYSIFKIHRDQIVHMKKWSDSFEDYYQSNFLAISPDVTNSSDEFKDLLLLVEKKKRTMQDPESGTHMALLLTAVAHTTGPILELGAGDYSTSLLHAVCSTNGRSIMTADTDKKLLYDFLDLQSERHFFTYVPVYEDDLELNPRPTLWDMVGGGIQWSVVLINHRPGERRVKDIERLRAHTHIFVVHDTQEAGYRYQPLLDSFKYKYVDERYATQTTLVSDMIDVAKFFID